MLENTNVDIPLTVSKPIWKVKPLLRNINVSDSLRESGEYVFYTTFDFVTKKAPNKFRGISDPALTCSLTNAFNVIA